MKFSDSFFLARRSRETDIFNLKVNTFLKIRYVDDFQKHRTFVVKTHNSALGI